MLRVILHHYGHILMNIQTMIIMVGMVVLHTSIDSYLYIIGSYFDDDELLTYNMRNDTAISGTERDKTHIFSIGEFGGSLTGICNYLYNYWSDGSMGNPGFENVIDGYLGEFVMHLMTFMFGEEAADTQRQRRSFVFSQSYDNRVGGFTSSNSRQITNLRCIFDNNLKVFGYFMPFCDLCLIFLFFTKRKQLSNVYYAKIVRKYMKNLKQYYYLKQTIKKEKIQIHIQSESKESSKQSSKQKSRLNHSKIVKKHHSTQKTTTLKKMQKCKRGSVSPMSRISIPSLESPVTESSIAGPSTTTSTQEATVALASKKT